MAVVPVKTVTVTVAMTEVVYALRASRMFSAGTSDASGMRGTRSWRSRIVRVCVEVSTWRMDG